MNEHDQTSSNGKRRRSHSTDTPKKRQHTFPVINISGSANACLGDVYNQYCDHRIVELTPEEERIALLSIVRYTGMNDRFAQIKSAASNTCDYIWDTNFGDWLSSSSTDTIFWIYGKPGSGKSTTMKYLIGQEQRLQRSLCATDREEQTWNIIHFFFDFRAADGLANTETGMLRSFINQYFQALELPYTELCQYKDQLQDVATSSEAMIALLIRVTQQQPSKILLFVDGLDETQTNLRSLIHNIRALAASTGLRVCLASRPEPLLVALLRDVPSLALHDHNSLAIECFVESSLAVLVDVPTFEIINYEGLVLTISYKANGIFLWAHLTIDIVIDRVVSGCSMAEVLTELEQVPDDLRGLYDNSLGRIPVSFRREASFLLQLIAERNGSIILAELHPMWLYFVYSTGISNTWQRQPDIQDFRLRLQGFVGSMIELDGHDKPNRRVRFIHETLRPFLANNSALLVSWAGPHTEELYGTPSMHKLYVHALTMKGEAVKDIYPVRRDQNGQLDQERCKAQKHSFLVEQAASKCPSLAISDFGILLGKLMVNFLRYFDQYAYDATEWSSPDSHELEISAAFRSPMFKFQFLLSLEGDMKCLSLPLNSVFPWDLAYTADTYYGDSLFRWRDVAALSDDDKGYLLAIIMVRRSFTVYLYDEDIRNSLISESVQSRIARTQHMSAGGLWEDVVLKHRSNYLREWCSLDYHTWWDGLESVKSDLQVMVKLSPELNSFSKDSPDNLNETLPDLCVQSYEQLIATPGCPLGDQAMFRLKLLYRLKLLWDHGCDFSKAPQQQQDLCAEAREVDWTRYDRFPDYVRPPT